MENVLGVWGSETCENQGEISKEGDFIFNAIYTIVDRGLADNVIEAAGKAGSKGGTVINARGSGIHETQKVFNILIEPEKEIVLILSEKENTKNVLDAITKELNIEEPGKGIMFVTNVIQTYGLVK